MTATKTVFSKEVLVKNVIKFGIIGCGLMGREFASAASRWCHILDAPARPVLVSVCDQNLQATEWFTSNFESITQATKDYHEVLGNPEVQAVYCPVPHNLHEQFYVEIMNAGKHLFGEKPFGISLSANKRILEAVNSHPDLVVRCSSEFPFFPAVQRIVRHLQNGDFGNIIEVECGFLHSSDLDHTKLINWKRIAAINGEYGCMGDLGLHVFHVPLRAGWRFKNVRAILSNIVPERKDASGATVPCDTWDNATLFCEVQGTGSAFPLSAKTQRIAPGETNTWYITIKGERLSARFNTKRPRTFEFLCYEQGAPQVWQTEDLGYDSAYRTITGKIFEFGFCDAFLQMCAAYCDQVARGNEATLPFGCATPEETHYCHRILTAALLSHRHGQVVPIE